MITLPAKCQSSPFSGEQYCRESNKEVNECA